MLLHHAVGEVNGRRGSWAHALGGMGVITEAMARGPARGARIETRASVARVLIEDGRALGVELESGRRIPARVEVVNVNPKLLYLRVIEPGQLAPEIRAHLQRYRCGSASFRMNVALSELPRFSAAPEARSLAAAGAVDGDHLRSGIILAPSLAYMDRAFAEARLHGYSRSPVIEMVIPSTLDESLATTGAPVASLFCQHFAPELPAGRDRDHARDEVVNLIIDTVTEYAPNFRRALVACSALTPMDLERRFGLTGGDIFHGPLGLEQMWAARPVLGFGGYRTPIRGLYLCGAGAHPGGGVSGSPGHNAARRIRQDRLARHRWAARLGRRAPAPLLFRGLAMVSEQR